jgi:choloylglycine hydrolase
VKKHINFKLNYFLIINLLVLPVNNLWACTGILLKTIQKSPVYARTLEFGLDLKSKVLFIPKNYQFTALTSKENQPGLSWKTQYAVVGLNAFDTENYVDGVNEQGLAGGLFYFSGFAKYQTVKDELLAKSMPMWQVLTWILTSFKNIDEVKLALPKIYVIDVILEQLHGSVPVHLIVHDLAGKSLVVEYVNGQLNMHDNPIGVFTNAPEFNWHLINLRNYINLSAHNAKSISMQGLNLSQLGQGSGMQGLPGDFTPASRFVRAAQFVQNTPNAKTELEAVYQAFHILNNFDIPKGSVINDRGIVEFTRWTSAIDLKNKIFYFKNYDNFQLQKVELSKMVRGNTKTKQISMSYKDQIVDRSI